ncbi:protease [Actinomadura sp. KC06]|uniref:SSI family serine proteinase inhibitor n=1 Tax=Actinomadura sp. KC06 TaxID=2530369 RepID=UPI0010531836|nr:SSI family serine proteinase inhibitor [Actinomadura sp. KC06]TDD28595.1 protease [Actinomadura sp. KC06]
MHMSRARFRWAALLAGMAVVTQAAPALAAPAQAKEPVGAYLLMVAPEHGSVTAVNLWCRPDGGTHRSPSEACDQLESVNGEVRRIAEKQGACTLEYAPVRVIADGRWRGKARHFAKTYPNRCAAVHQTGGVLFR